MIAETEEQKIKLEKLSIAFKTELDELYQFEGGEYIIKLLVEYLI